MPCVTRLCSHWINRLLPPMQAWFPDDSPSLNAVMRTRRFCMPGFAPKRAPCQFIGSVFTPLWRLSVPEFVRRVRLSRTCLEVKKNVPPVPCPLARIEGTSLSLLTFCCWKGDALVSFTNTRGVYQYPQNLSTIFHLYSEVVVRENHGARNIESQKIGAVP